MKQQKFIIRNAAFTDAEAIFLLIRKYPEELLIRPLGDIVRNIDRCLVCEYRGAIVGTVSWQILPEIGKPSAPTVEIRSLAVDPDFKGRGIGRRLVEEALRRIRILKPAQVIALTFAPEFFLKLGFKKIEKSSIMHKIYVGCMDCPKFQSPFTCPEIAMAMTFNRNKRE